MHGVRFFTWPPHRCFLLKKIMCKEKILVLGFGNEVLTDDGIAVKLVKHLKENDKNPQIVYDTSWLGGLEILEYLNDDYKAVVFIDAIITGKNKPGAIEQYDLDNFKETLHLSNLHDSSFINTIKLGRKLGYKIPEYIKVISIEIVEDKLFGNNFSMEIESKYSEIKDSVSAILHTILETIK